MIQDLLLPQAEAEAKEKQSLSQGQGIKVSPMGDTLNDDKVGVLATRLAAARSHGLVSARTLQRMQPVRQAPKTQERMWALVHNRSLLQEGIGAPISGGAGYRT